MALAFIARSYVTPSSTRLDEFQRVEDIVQSLQRSTRTPLNDISAGLRQYAEAPELVA
jgi:hypothetical protein